jgi:hypothetical protein
VKNNKEGSIAIAKHANQITPELFTALQRLDDLSPIKPNIECFVKYVM